MVSRVDSMCSGPEQYSGKAWVGSPSWWYPVWVITPGGCEAFTLSMPHGTSPDTPSYDVLLPLADFNLCPFPVTCRNRDCATFKCAVITNYSIRRRF